nr:hypothetical protein CFP56_12863 [Quercus suber]
MPNGAGFATSAAVGSARSSIVVVCWGWEAKDWWWRKRGRGEGKRDGELDRQREAESVEDSAASWIDRELDR